MSSDEGQDFFISYTDVNRPWAEWIAVELERVGYSTVLQAWDFAPGSDFVHKMQQATTTAKRTIAILSPAYFGSKFGEAEWHVAFAKDPTGEAGLLVPVRVQPCEPPGLLATRVYVDLVDVDEVEARRRLLAGVDPERPRPAAALYPGIASRGPGSTADERRRFPGLGPVISNLPARNRNFSGREDMLLRLHSDLQSQQLAAVVPTSAIHGLGGIGKTQLVLEYAHRFASDYDVIWWIPAEQPTSVVTALAALAHRLGIAEVAHQGETALTLFTALRERDRWLLVYDNAESPERLDGLLPPGGDGQVVLTSRWAHWTTLASPLLLPVLTRPESVEFLRQRTGTVDEASLAALADLLGDLPLALEEAAAYLEQTGESLTGYLELLHDRARELFGMDNPAENAGADGDRRRVATVWSVSLQRVHEQAPAAEALLDLMAFLAPDVPRTLLTEQPGVLPNDVAVVVSDRLAYNQVLAVLGRYSLVTLNVTTIGLHRLVQAVIRARLGLAGERAWAEAAVSLLREAFPNDSWEVSAWPACERLMPHLLSVTAHAQRLAVAGAESGWLLGRASTYLRGRGQYLQARPLAEQAALQIGEAALGPDHVGILLANLGMVLHDLGDLAGARTLLKQVLQIRHHALSADHPEMGTWRNNLGLVLHDLGDLAGARIQHEQALQISEAALGPDHPDVGTWRNHLGLVLHDLGDLAGARIQYEQALQISEAALGPDHPAVTTIRDNLNQLGGPPTGDESAG